VTARSFSLDNLYELSPPDVLAQEIIEHLETALNFFRDVAAGLEYMLYRGIKRRTNEISR